MVTKILHTLKTGDRVKLVGSHPWMPERYGTIKHIEYRIGNRFIVKFDTDELGLWHDEDGDPALRLGENDLILVEKSVHLAA